jgi:hypothetical protein
LVRPSNANPNKCLEATTTTATKITFFKISGRGVSILLYLISIFIDHDDVFALRISQLYISREQTV